MSVTIEKLSHEQIRIATEGVLNDYQTERVIPVEIEEIIEFGFGIEVRPINALYSRFGFEGALSRNLDIIRVDADLYKRKLNRLRFTLAHELGHCVLHGDYLISLSINDKEEWKQAVTDIDPTTYGWMEFQAYTFAGHVLVPSENLLESCKEAEAKALQNGINLSAIGEDAISYVAGWIAKDYKVSTEVIERRLRNDKIVFGDL